MTTVVGYRLLNPEDASQIKHKPNSDTKAINWLVRDSGLAAVSDGWSLEGCTKIILID